ncbi:hypothetical protein N752_06215 [Desulforamulus aquiferis]|nr:hypothetical protein [Desulforamulus aquiferis]RYD06121.1 hypothetical protein N752_06215 [Desulforamulus aquiferis]
MFKKNIITLAFMIILLAVTGCSNSNSQGESKEQPAGKKVGTLQFMANGEDFIREGFISKDGWALTFEHVYVNLSEITAYQAEPPYDAHNGGEVTAKEKVALAGSLTVDLAEGDEDAHRCWQVSLRKPHWPL